MNNGEKTAQFLLQLPAASRIKIVNAIAAEYRIGYREAYEEVTDDEAEPLLEYLKEPLRSATKTIASRRGITI